MNGQALVTLTCSNRCVLKPNQCTNVALRAIYVYVEDKLKIRTPCVMSRHYYPVACALI